MLNRCVVPCLACWGLAQMGDGFGVNAACATLLGPAWCSGGGELPVSLSVSLAGERLEVRLGRGVSSRAG